MDCVDLRRGEGFKFLGVRLCNKGEFIWVWDFSCEVWWVGLEVVLEEGEVVGVEFTDEVVDEIGIEFGGSDGVDGLGKFGEVGINGISYSRFIGGAKCIFVEGLSKNVIRNRWLISWSWSRS